MRPQPVLGFTRLRSCESRNGNDAYISAANDRPIKLGNVRCVLRRSRAKVWADMLISTPCVGSARQPRQVAEIAVKRRCISNQSSQKEFCDWPIDMKLIWCRSMGPKRALRCN